MTRDDYVNMRKTGQIAVSLFHKYWMENKKEDYYDYDEQQFGELFTMFLEGSMIPQANVVNKVVDYFDKQYAIVKVLKNGEQIGWM